MTTEKAIEILSDVGDINRCCAEDAEALDIAINALERASCIKEKCAYCPHCEHCDVDDETLAIKALEPCEDCISRQEAISAIIDEYYPDAIAIDIVDSIANLPSVTPKPKTGRWIDIQYFKADDTYYRPKCPFCGIEPKEYSNYCPNCGAKMEEVEE